MRAVLGWLCILAAAVLSIAAAFAASYALALSTAGLIPAQPYCPTEDSCLVEYHEPGGYVIVEVTP